MVVTILQGQTTGLKSVRLDWLMVEGRGRPGPLPLRGSCVLDSCLTGGSVSACAWLVKDSSGLRQSYGSVGDGEDRMSTMGLCVYP